MAVSWGGHFRSSCFWPGTIHTTRSSHWEPPWASWRCRLGLPYGWEQARDDAGNVYYIDHINRTTTYSDPRESIAPEGRRTVKIQRRPEIGFGFVAAGQHPTIIQFVSAEGPSDGLLYANDQILAVNGKDVRQESKDNVVAMVRSANDELELTVEQLPARPRSSRRSCRVRFTDRVLVASMPDGDIMNSIFSKLQLRAKQYFALAIEYSLGARSSRISLLRPETKIVTIIRMPNSDHLRCVFRFAFLPKDLEALWLEDPRALDYYYQQCTADVVRGRYAFEMRYEACVRLAALHMQQVTIESNLLKENNTVSLTRLESEYGLNSFLPSILLENVKRREIRKHVRYYLKKDSAKLSESLAKQCTRCDGQQSLLSLRVTDASVSLRSLDLTSEPPPYELANSFAESLDEKRTASHSPRSEKSKSPISSRRNSDVTKKLLKATDSLLIKNSQKLQRKENGSPLASRSARQMESVSDSSDAEDSSWSSPVRSPFIDGAIRKMMNGPPDGLVYEPGRRESIETLISSVHAQQVPNLETLILFYQDSNGVKSKMPPIKENGASAAISQGDDRNVVAAPMASIEEEMTISQITAAS
ncbi:PDZ/DHR/GLGF domain protein [Teladorsagia circumcincta]|uniref:PDZ/DHR/GLGF domain protein n=1 Tax=Teladorsagia circumcincta TaxID=45464 RepID=A0A2G9USZ9_TELCI|nr:PDZ/DHR/GLGF domain protein [Teladorsagia circumcincta]